MRRTAFILCAAAVAAGCSDYLGPSGPEGVYALTRVGPTPLPVFLGDNQNFPLLLADTLRLFQIRPRNELSILEHVSVLRLGDSRETRAATEHYYSAEDGRISYDECPIGAACFALMAAPRVYQVVGDSLFEVLPATATRPPYVYGLVRY